MGGEFASGEASQPDDDRVELAAARAWEMDPAALPSFKQLPRHRRADHRQAATATDPPLDLGPMRMPEAVPTPHAPLRRRWRPLRAAALLLVGSAIGAAATLATSTNPIESKYLSESKYLTVLPPAAPAAPPPQIIYVDKWRIVSPEPQLLQRYQVFAPAIPIAPPPKIIIIERAGKTLPAAGAKPKAPETSPRLPEMRSQAPETRHQHGDVEKEIERWLSGSPADR